MRQVLGYEPVYTTAEAFAEFAAAQRPGPFRADLVRAVEGALLEALGGGDTRSGARRVPAATGGGR